MTPAQLQAAIDTLAAHEARASSRNGNDPTRAAWCRAQRLEFERRLENTRDPRPIAGAPGLFEEVTA